MRLALGELGAELRDKARMHVVAERLRGAVAETRLAEADAVGVTISVGISVFPQHAGEEAGLLGAADRALYRAKADGRNRIVLADSSLSVAL
ncbi:MAG TPA: diguanylate cyclase [Candidatus Xenobia bacterium]|nr:diguanylate cyclase [Candidatus Xenobia bacterium]